MSKSAIYTAVTSGIPVTDGGTLPVGNTIRRFGCNVVSDNNTINLCGIGYYKVDAVATMAAASAAPITISLIQDGVPVPGAKSTITVAGTSEETVLPVTAIVRNKCDCESTLSFTVSGADVTLDNFAVTVEKL